MIGRYSNNGSVRIGVEIPSFFLCFLILLCVSLPVKGSSSRPPETIYESQNLYLEKFFLNIDNEKITLIARSNPVGSILEEIGKRSGVEIKISSVLRSRKITLKLNGVSLDEGIKKIAEKSSLLFRRDKEGNFYLSELPVYSETVKQSNKIPGNRTDGSALSNASTDAAFSQNNTGEDIYLNEMVIRFNQDIPEQVINQFLSVSNIKVKKYIAALKYHILSLPEGMSYYDAMVLFKNKKMLYHAEPDYLVPVK